jgi:antitoxin component of RelBE/YafQ-DinJ toxin-antitoxin module
MKEKLTLSIDKKTKDLAKKFAKRRGITVSGMVEHFLRTVIRQEEGWQPREGSITSKLTGSIPDIANHDYESLVTEALMQKYGYEKNSD